MDVLNVLIPVAFATVLALGAKVVWMSGFVAGTMQETKRWLDALDKLAVPNWQSLPITGDDKTMTPEQSKLANQIFVSAYKLALDRIRAEIADLRREALEKATAEEGWKQA
jgi:hypothetical protein